jgi:hypothetical protein
MLKDWALSGGGQWRLPILGCGLLIEQRKGGKKRLSAGYHVLPYITKGDMNYHLTRQASLMGASI